MQDRVSQYPGRVKLTPVSGQENVYDMEWADGATVVGDPLNKNTFLTDATAALYGLGPDAVPDQALAKARQLITTAQNTANSANTNANSRLRIVTGTYVGTGTYGKDNKNKLTLQYTPKLILISFAGSYNPGQSVALYVVGILQDKVGLYFDSQVSLEENARFSIITSSFAGKTAEWYSMKAIQSQFNALNVVYNYTAFCVD